jgi:hypothetical protein
MLQLPAFFRHIGSPINPWLRTFARRKNAVTPTTIVATRMPVSEVDLSRDSEQFGYVQAELKDEDKTPEKPAIELISFHPTLPQQGDPGISWPIGCRTESA